MNNVLIIEDDKEICVMIKDHLEKYNYQVFFTLTGANAIERIKELSPDLIILDLMLPFISGDELIRNIRKFSDVPVIVVSAKSLTFNKVELLRLGADDYLTKPFDLDELLARIERNLLRSQKDTPNLCLTFGELSINTSSKIVTVADEIIVLTAKEYQLVTVFEAINITKKYRNTLALNQVSMSVMQGDIYGFIGENGAGKTTMIRLLTGLAEPTTGKIALFGESNKKLAKQRERIGCIIESPSLYLDMTAYENLEVQRLQRGIPGKGCIDNALALVGLKDTGKKKAKDFSLGMRQRLALAIALLGNPEFLVLDEPINGLDPTGIIELRNLLKRLNKERGITILISSHILTELHSKLLERFYVADVSRSNGTSGQGLYIVKKLLLMMNCTNPIIEIHDHNFMITIDFSPLLIKK